MGIVLTVLEPPHPPEPSLLRALPPGIGRVIDVEPRLVSPRYDTLLVTTRGLVVRDHVSGDFSGVPWTNFSLDAHLRQRSRHAVLLLWLNERRPIEVAVTRRLALNIASVAPVLKLHPTLPVDDIVVAEAAPDVVDLRDHVRIDAPAPRPTDRVGGIPRPYPMAPVNVRRDRNPDHGRERTTDRGAPSPGRRPQTSRLLVGVAVLVLAGAVGGVASIVVNTDGSPADGSVPMISSEPVEIDQIDR